MASLDPPPLSTPLGDKGGITTTAWGRWFSLLQSILTGYSTPSGVQAVTSFLNSWTNQGGVFAAVAYWVDASGLVHLSGQLKGGATGSIAFQLPIGFRPSASQQFAIMYNNAFGYATIDSAGNVTLTSTGAGSFVTLNGITFLAGG